MPVTATPISADERGMASITHLSGLAGYIIPLGGIIVPIIIWVLKSESRVLSSIAKQAILLNVVVWLVIGVTAILWFTFILIPVVMLFWLALAGIALALPIIGAVRASERTYYKYPVVGVEPV